jgi:hypothetical protein
MVNNNITNVNHLTFNDSGANEGLQWLGGSDWRIFESPDSLTNAAGNLQFTTGGTRRMTLSTGGSAWTSSQGTLWGASNDGSGSGLDADLLDGQHGSYYTNASNLGNGTVPDARLSSNVHFVTTSASTPSNGNLSIGYDGSTYSYVQSHSSKPLRLNPLGNAVQIGSGNTVWHAGNDGSGSGLDADLLDGQHGSYYRSASNLNAGTVPLDRMNKVLPSSGNYVWNNSTTAGSYTLGLQCSFVSSGQGFPNFGSVLHVGARGGSDAGGDYQIYCGHGSNYGGNHLRFRNADNDASPTDSWTGWKTLWDSGNDGSGSGLDADLLDGYNTSTSATANTVAVRNGSGHIYGNYILGSYLNASSGNNENPTIGQVWTQSTGDNYLRKSTPAHFKSQLGLWHTGNDGSGSGLDADTLDGLQLMSSTTNNQANKVMRTDANGYANFGWIYTASGTATNSLSRIYCSQDGYLRYLSPSSLGTSWLRENTYNNLSDSTGHGANLNTVFNNDRSGNIDCWSGSNFPPSTSHVQGVQVRHSTNSHYGFQLVNQYNQDKIWHRRITNNSFGGWQQVWTANSDGAGSGLDADTLDGQHGSYYYSAANPPPSGGDTVTYGTFTPTVTSGSVSGATGSWMRVGDMVTVTFRLYNLSDTSTWSAIQILMPFTCKSGLEYRAIGPSNNDKVSYADDTVYQIEHNTAYATPWRRQLNSSYSYQAVQYSQLDNYSSATLQGTLTYRVA